MMKLYYCPRTRAFRALWMLEEIGAPYELTVVDIRKGAQDTAEYRAVNPMMKVPALVDGDATMGETGAILIYLADKFPGAKLAPALTDPRRGRYLQWMFFGTACVEPAFAEKFAGWTPNPFSFAWGDFPRVVQVLEDGLASAGPWIMGAQFTAADILLGSGVEWGLGTKLLTERPAFTKYLEHIHSRPAYQRANEIETRESASATSNTANRAPGS
ncbi:MAG TPA: glutathione S-transferase family protein [Candidatus Binataceae bacterium]